MNLIPSDYSTRNTHMLAQDLRAVVGRRSIESNLKDVLYEQQHRLDEYFETKELRFTKLDKETKQKINYKDYAVLCKDVNGLIDYIMAERELHDDNTLIRIGLDGGRGFMKICLSVFDINNSTESKKTFAKKFKNSGVKKLFILAIVPDLSENFWNIKMLWTELQLHKLTKPYKIATYLKLCNILLGLQSHSSKHPCSWCDIDKSNLHIEGSIRTFGNLKAHYWSFFDSKASTKEAKEHGNAIHPSILTGDDNTPLVVILPTPELHLLLGTVNHICDKMEELWPDVTQWFNGLHIQRTDYQGGQFEGNDCCKLLKNVDKLIEICPVFVNKYAAVLKLFNDVVASSFGANLSVDYINKLAKFKDAYLKLGEISVTPKVHAVFFHVEECLKFTNNSSHGLGLAPFSEQTIEAVHHDFKPIWKNYVIKKKDHPNYPNQLLRAVSAYNSQHI